MTQHPDFKKNISTFSLTMTGVTAIIGSGWLLGTQKIALIAGPASLLSWVVGALVALLVGLFYIEIGSSHPSSGGIGYYSHLTHGRFCGFLTSWINWLSIVAVPPIEAQGIVQYLSQLQISSFFNNLYNLQTHNLTAKGIFIAIIFMLFFMFINYWSVKIFIRFNNFFTLIKVIVPLLTIIALTYSGLHPENFGNSLATFVPFGWKSVLTSVVACGVVMSFNGFQSPLTFSEEVASPKRQLPIAVIGSIGIAFVIYLLLQIVFIGSIDPATLANGWSSINFRSPYVDLLLLANLHLMVTTVYVGSVISPSACGAAFIASGARIMHSLSSEGHLPGFLGFLNPEYRNPRHAIVACAIVGTLFLFMFKGWYTLVAVISVMHLFSYVPAPIITIANRIKNKELHKGKESFTLPFANIIAPFLLFIISVLIFEAAWPLADEMALLIIPGLGFFFYYEYKYRQDSTFWHVFKGASWLILYIIGISIITFLGNNSLHSSNFISTQVSLISLAVLSLITYFYGAYYSLDHKPYASPSYAND